MTVIRRAHGRPTRSIAVLALTAPLAGALVLTTAAPAFASQSVKVTFQGVNDGDVLSSATDVNVIGTITNTGSTTSGGTLYVDGPANASDSPYHSSTGISGCNVPALSSSCSKSAQSSILASSMTSRRNGRWSASVNGSGTKGFWTNFRPTADPTNLAASAVGRNEVDLSWQYAGTEVDKAGFEIVESHNGSSRTIPVPAGVCSGTSCGYAITGYPTPPIDTTETYTYTVTALRDSGGCGTCGQYTRSNASSSASAQLVGPPPPPSPTPSPTGGTTGGTTGGSTTTTGGSSGGSTGGSSGGSTSGSTGGSTSGGSTGSSTTGDNAGKPIAVPTLPPIVASRKAFALGFNNFSPSLGIPKLPPLPAITAPGSSNDTYAPTLPYKGGQSHKTTNVLSSPIATVTNLDTAQLARLAAVALLLLVCAAHVRLFLTTSDED